MKQLTQNLKDGKMELLEVPFPQLQRGYLLVRNHFSAISAGTEGKTVTDARKGYIAKARSREKEVKQVIEMIKSQGFVDTYKTVMNKLDAPSALGYSSAGEVIGVGEGVTGFVVGDLVTCGGSGAVHAEVVSVPVNLCVKVSDVVNLSDAAITTVAAIAIQGIRQAELNFGENCVVIGMGLIGQLTSQILSASGVRVLGIDVDPNQIQLAKSWGMEFAFSRNTVNLEAIINDFSFGYGADAVIITAATVSHDPVELAGRILRKKGKVVIVGAVPTGFSRENYYKKELDLRMSSSYGPGRYDLNYEEKGIDYPVGYVRWTENRNMQSYIDLLQRKKINPSPLVTHVFEFENAPQAYDMILSKNEHYAGILLKYNVQKELGPPVLVLSERKSSKGKANVGFIGAGSFAQNLLLPNLVDRVNFVGVSTARGNTAVNVANKYHFNIAYDSADKLIADDYIDTLFIATRHNLHTEFVLKGLNAGKNVFTEKPLCMTEGELLEIQGVMQTVKSHLMVGFNRRFAPLISEIKKRITPVVPVSINYRINSGNIPAGHWVQDPEIGGGRIIGEVCHFIDLCSFIAGSPVSSVSALSLDSPENFSDTLVINLKMKNGSIASITYFSNGNKSLEKEHLEVFSSGNVYIVNDFKECIIYENKQQHIKSKKQDKGHKKELELFVESLKGKEPLIPFDQLFNSTLATFKVIESIKTSQIVTL